MADELNVENAEQIITEPNNIETKGVTDRTLDYEELLKNDKKLQALIDKKVTQAAQTAREKEAERQRILADTRISEEAKFKAMSKDEQINALARKLEEAQQRYERDKAADGLKNQVVDAFVNKGIPKVFADIFKYHDMTAEEAKNIIDVFSQLEYYPAGELERRTAKALDDRLKQKQSENKMVTGNTDWQQQYDAAMKNRNTLEALRIKREAYAKGVIVG